MEHSMKTRLLRLSIWVLGIGVLAASLVGANMALHSRAGDAAVKEEAPAPAPPVEGAVCIAYVDVEERVRDLYPSRPGRVLEVLVREGEPVKKGAVLFRMEDQAAEYLVLQAEADLRAAEKRLEDANKLPAKHRLDLDQQKQAIVAKQGLLAAERYGLERLQRLLKSNNAPQDEVNVADARVQAASASVAVEEKKLKQLELVDPSIDIARAKAEVDAKRAMLDSARFACDDCKIKAPSAGRVLRLSVGAGETIGTLPKQPPVQFLPDGPRIVRAEVEQEFANRVKEGQTADIQDDSKAGPVWHGKVVRISDWYTHRRSIVQEPLQFNDVRTLECIIQLDPQPQMPRIGQRVRVLLGSLASQK
jgi:multidrug resistance efflux pump